MQMRHLPLVISSATLAGTSWHSVKEVEVATLARREVWARLVAWLLPAFAFGGVVGFVDPLLPRLLPRRGESRAAVAIRDNVTPFQKWGSRAFTLRHLSRHYDRVWYFTAESSDDRREEFVAALREALRDHDAVDVWLLAHSNRCISWVGALDDDLLQNLRFVYNTGCYGSSQGDSWLRAGADAYVGHPGRSESPVFYFHFLRRWVRGGSLGDAVEESNTKTLRALAGIGVLHGDAVSVEEVWLETRATLLGDPAIDVETIPGGLK